MFFFACPKKNQKKTPEIDIQPDFGKELCGTVVQSRLNSSNPTLKDEVCIVKMPFFNSNVFDSIRSKSPEQLWSKDQATAVNWEIS